MTLHYRLTKDMRRNRIVYKCVNCNRKWGVNMKEPITPLHAPIRSDNGESEQVCML